MFEFHECFKLNILFHLLRCLFCFGVAHRQRFHDHMHINSDVITAFGQPYLASEVKRVCLAPGYLISGYNVLLVNMVASGSLWAGIVLVKSRSDRMVSNG